MSAVNPTDQLDFGSLAALYPDSQNPRSPWYIYAAVTIVGVASVQHVTELWKYLASKHHDEDSRLIIARRLREALLKSSPLVGFPRVRTTHCLVSQP